MGVTALNAAMNQGNVEIIQFLKNRHSKGQFWSKFLTIQKSRAGFWTVIWARISVSIQTQRFKETKIYDSNDSQFLTTPKSLWYSNDILDFGKMNLFSIDIHFW